MPTYAHFYDLPVYKRCRAFRKLIADMLHTHLPKKETFLLKAQTLSSSRSITANIAEGFGRFHYQENIQFCRHARGSLTETMDHMITAHDEDYIDKPQLIAVNVEYKLCLIELNSYIKYLNL